MSNQVSRLYEFGEFRVDLRKALLLHHGRPVAVPPKAYETLIALVESDGRVIAKEELMAKVWGDTFVEENNLTQQISLLRKVLGDAEQKIIETVPRRGYRFAADVRVVEDVPAPAASRRRLVWLFAPIVLVAVAVVAVWVSRRTTDMPRTLAVLPFKPLAGGSADAYLQLGMADTLITDLSSVRGIRVRPTSSVLGYTAQADPVAAGRKLGVEAVLDGRIQRAGDRVRVTAQLVRVADGSSLWAGKFDEDLKNIFAVQDAISARIIQTLMLDLTGEEKRSLGKEATRSAEAYELYLRGRYHWYRWTPDDWNQARDYFERAVAKDPNFALAWVGLADSIAVQNFVRPPKEVADDARAALAKALTLDGTLADAYSASGAMALFYDWNRAEAVRRLRRAITLNPNLALSHDIHALTLASDGRFDEALVESHRARELDPTSPYMNTDLGSIYYFQRDYDRALQHVRVALAIDPNYVDGLRYLAAIEEQRKNHAQAIDAYARMTAFSGDPQIAEAMRAGLASSGYEGALRAWLDALTKKAARTYVSPLEFAEIHARLGDRESTFAWLRKARDERAPNLIWAGVEPRWDPYRDDPRFRELLTHFVSTRESPNTNSPAAKSAVPSKTR